MQTTHKNNKFHVSVMHRKICKLPLHEWMRFVFYFLYDIYFNWKMYEPQLLVYISDRQSRLIVKILSWRPQLKIFIDQILYKTHIISCTFCIENKLFSLFWKEKWIFLNGMPCCFSIQHQYLVLINKDQHNICLISIYTIFVSWPFWDGNFSFLHMIIKSSCLLLEVGWKTVTRSGSYPSMWKLFIFIWFGSKNKIYQFDICNFFCMYVCMLWFWYIFFNLMPTKNMSICRLAFS